MSLRICEVNRRSWVCEIALPRFLLCGLFPLQIVGCSRAVPPVAVPTIPVDVRAEHILGNSATSQAEEFSPEVGPLRGVLLQSGGVAVTAGAEIRIYDSLGNRVATNGRRGAGPGEFRGLTSICATSGDTLVAWDEAARRISVVTARGAFVRNLVLPNGSSFEDACFDDGTFIVGVLGAARRNFPNGVVHLARTRLDGTIVDTFPAAAAEVSDFAVPHELQVVATGQDLYVGDSDQGRIVVYSDTRGGQSTVTVGAAPMPLPADLRERRLRSGVRMNQPSNALAILRRLKRLPHRERWPAFDKLKVDAAGRLWVEGYNQGPSSTSTWRIFSPGGCQIATVVIPPGPDGTERHLLSIGDKRILVRYDDDDQTRVGIFSLATLADSVARHSDGRAPAICRR